MSKIIMQNVGGAVLGAPNFENKLILTREGEIAQNNIENCNKKMENVLIAEYIIMPNHIHMIVILTKRGAEDCAPYNSKNN